jgi:D-threonate/D-erythronate kinase
VADDLTGACDAAVAFSQRGLRTRVALTEMPKEEAYIEVCAFSTGSRDLPVEEAVRRLSNIATICSFATTPCLFKKIDSVFRGNTAREIAAAVTLFGADLSIVAPAYPALGRICRNGVIHVHDLDGERTIQAMDVLRSVGLDPRLLACEATPEILEKEMLKTARLHRNGMVYCDAIEQSDLEAVVEAAARLRQRILWIGSGGLAHALAATHQPHISQATEISSGTVLMFVGSDHPVTSHQLHHLRAASDVICWHPGTHHPEGIANAIAVLIPIDLGSTKELELTHLAQQFDPCRVSCLFMTGGDTATFVCRALGIKSLDLQVEFAPGLPQGLANGGRFKGKTVVLKSGGFGEASVMSRIVDSFAPRERYLRE